MGLPIREGVVAARVVIDGPADQAGIRPGELILSVDGQKVATAEQLVRMLRQDLEVGQEVQMEIFRDGTRELWRLFWESGRRSN